MTARRVRTAISATEHLSVAADLRPLCGIRRTTFTFYPIPQAVLPLCLNCQRCVERLSRMAAGAPR